MAVFCEDRGHDAWETFLWALKMAGDGPAMHIEDDVVFATQFVSRAAAVIAEKPDAVIQFFSRRKHDLTVGSRWMSGSSFMSLCCVYFPAGLSGRIGAYARGWTGRDLHPIGIDLMVANYLRANRLRYWVQVPSLVQHRASKSVIDPRRSSKRQSPTFDEAPDD